MRRILPPLHEIILKSLTCKYATLLQTRWSRTPLYAVSHRFALLNIIKSSYEMIIMIIKLLFNEIYVLLQEFIYLFLFVVYYEWSASKSVIPSTGTCNRETTCSHLGMGMGIVALLRTTSYCNSSSCWGMRNSKNSRDDTMKRILST